MSMRPHTRDDGPSDMEWLLAELERMPGDASTKERFRGLLRGMAGRRIYFAKSHLIRPERIRIALAMLDAGFSATQARAELAAVAQLGRRTAERVMAQALNERAMRHQREMQRRQMSLELELTDGPA